MRRLPVLAAVLLAGCVTSAAERERGAAEIADDAARLAKRLAGYAPGAPVNCMRSTTEGVTIYGDTLVYRDGGRRLYVTRTTGGCFGLRRDDIIVTQSFGGGLCSGDIVRTVDRTSGFVSGSCTFGEFVPYVRPPRR